MTFEGTNWVAGASCTIGILSALRPGQVTRSLARSVSSGLTISAALVTLLVNNAHHELCATAGALAMPFDVGSALILLISTPLSASAAFHASC